VQAYYVVQVEKIFKRYELLKKEFGEELIRARLDDASRAILDEFLEHGRAVREERERAVLEHRAPHFLPLLQHWGGVTIAYRRGLKDSPAYTRNHEEVIKALEEGIYYAEHLEPKAARLDRHGQIIALVCTRQARDADGKWHATTEEVVLPARSVFVATGARPNVAYEFEHKGHFAKEHGHYQTHRVDHDHVVPLPVAEHCKVDEFGAFTSYANGDKRVSFIGDTHPVFHGSVVKAVASGLRTYPKIVQSFGPRAAQRGELAEYRRFREQIAEQLQARVVNVERVHERVVRLTVKAPLAADRFRPGQFFRLQNFETRAQNVAGTKLQTEALALTGAHIDKDAGTVTLLVLEGGASARVCATFKPGDPLSLMGPGGVRTKIPDDAPETVMIVAGPVGVPHVLGVGPALRANGNRVLLFAVFDSPQAVFCREELEHAVDTVVWIADGADPATAIAQYAGADPAIALQDVDRLLIVGDPCLVRQIREARKQALKPFFTKGPREVIGSISTPMQCMLKGVCSQCLQWQIDPTTGVRTKAVFGCSWQDQPVDIVDLDNLEERLSQNRLQEKLSNLWLDYVFKHHAVPRV
jgi:NAD(P)H-flavin reductase